MKKLLLFPLMCLLLACDFETPYERAVRRAYNACLESGDVTETRGCDCILHYSKYHETLIVRYSATYVELLARQVGLLSGLYCINVSGK